MNLQNIRIFLDRQQSSSQSRFAMLSGKRGQGVSRNSSDAGTPAIDREARLLAVCRLRRYAENVSTPSGLSRSSSGTKGCAYFAASVQPIQKEIYPSLPSKNQAPTSGSLKCWNDVSVSAGLRF